MNAILDFLLDLFGPDLPNADLGLGQIAARCVLVYMAGLTAIRLGKSRLLSRASPMDVLLAFILGSLLSRGISGSASLSVTIAATVTLVALHWLLSQLSSRSHWWGTLLKGNTYLLVWDGEIQWHNMRRAHISEADLHEQMRLHANLEDVRSVKAAYKERSGEIGIVKQPVAPQIIDVRVEEGVQVVRIAISREA